MNTDEGQLHIPLAENLSALHEADHPWDVYALLQSAREGKTKSGEPFLTLTLVDLSTTLEAKIWANSRQAMQAAKAAEPNTFVKLRGTFEPYNGKPQLNVSQLRTLKDGEEHAGFDQAQIIDPALAAVEDLVCQRLVIDIETVPAYDRDALPESVEDALVKFAQRKEPASSDDVLDARIGMAMGLSPLFGKVISIALGDGDAPDGDVKVIAVPNEKFPVEAPPDWVRFMSEADLLRSFWALASKAETVVTFNGKNFDIPFLVGRSLVHGIPARCDLLSQRYALKPHLDLFDLLKHSDKAPSKLEVICWALGIESPKGDMDGSKVAPAYARGEILKIAEYNRHDVRATGQVFRKLRDHVLRFRKDWS